MKRLLLSLFVLAVTGWYAGVHAQTGACGVTELTIQNAQLVQGTTCTYTFDAAFTIKASSKFVFVQSYIDNNTPDNPHPYPDFWDCNAEGTTSQPGRADPPTGTQVGNPILNIAIDNSGDEPELVDYLPDEDVDIVGVVAGTTIESFELPNGDTRFNIYDLQITIPAAFCGEPFVLITDFFATNSNNPNVIQCVSCNVRFAIGFFSVLQTSVSPCITGEPFRSLTATLQNNTAATVSGTYQLYVDVNGNQLLTPGVDTPIPGAAGSFTIAAGSTTTITVNNVPVEATGVILVTRLTGGGFGSGAAETLFIPIPECVPLPVKFKSFTASRKAQIVALQWETASESDNKGFYVQRNTGRGWSNVSFITSKAEGGNSSAELTYQFTDANTEKGVSQYRIQQVDIDGRTDFSEIRSVRGLEQAAKTIIYPNPSNGSFNIVFDNASGKDVFISDMSGRVLKQWRGVNNNVQVDNMLSGIYTVRVVDLQTGTQTSEKIVVNKK